MYFSVLLPTKIVGFIVMFFFVHTLRKVLFNLKFFNKWGFLKYQNTTNTTFIRIGKIQDEIYILLFDFQFSIHFYRIYRKFPNYYFICIPVME